MTTEDQPAWLMSRVAPPMLGVGGLLSLATFLVPGYLAPSLWARTMMAATGVGACVVGMALYRVPVRSRWMLAIGLGADLQIVLASTALAHPPDIRVVAVTFAISTVLIALFVPPRVYLVKLTSTLVGAAAMLALSGESLPLLALHTAMITFGTGAPGYLVLGLRGSLEQALDVQRRMAATDPLTGLANRRGLEGGLPLLVPDQRSADGDAAPVLGVVVLDLDHFKWVNDRHGHLIGDQVIRLVAEAIRRTVRKDDLVARLGGEELAVVTVMDPAGLADLAERIRLEVQVAGRPWEVTVSVGVAWLPWASRHPADLVDQVWTLVDRADDLMYEAKRAGRNRVILLDPGERVSGGLSG